MDIERIELQFFADPPDGDLFIAEAQKQIPFDIKRVYFINNLANPQAVRGKHAHKACNQAIFCINGSFTLQLDNGTQQQDVVMNNPVEGIMLRPLMWHTMTNFSPDCVILVLADDYYDEADYIRDYDAFKKSIT